MLLGARFFFIYRVALPVVANPWVQGWLVVLVP